MAVLNGCTVLREHKGTNTIIGEYATEDRPTNDVTLERATSHVTIGSSPLLS